MHDARMPDQQSQADLKNALPAIPTGVALGVLVEVPAALLAVISGGAGHGDYVLARALFPLPVLLADLLGETSWIWIAILLQFPLYGALLGWSSGQRRLLGTAIPLAALHIAAASAAFAWAMPAFYR